MGARKSSFSLKSRGTVVGLCRKCTMGRRHASPLSWILSLVLRRWRRPSCSVPVVVMARGGPGPPGRSAGVHTRRSRSVWKSRTPRRGGPGFYSYALSTPFGRTRDIIGPLPQWEAGPDGRCRQKSNGSSAEPVLSRIAGPKVLLQHPAWRSGDRSQRMGPRSHPLWEWRPNAACPGCRFGDG